MMFTHGEGQEETTGRVQNNQEMYYDEEVKSQCMTAAQTQEEHKKKLSDEGPLAMPMKKQSQMKINEIANTQAYRRGNTT